MGIHHYTGRVITTRYVIVLILHNCSLWSLVTVHFIIHRCICFDLTTWSSTWKAGLRSWPSVACLLILSILLLHLLLLFLFSLKHTLQSISGIITWSIRHSMFSNSLILNDRWNDTLCCESFNNIVTRCHLWHRFLLVNKCKAWNLSLFSRIQQL